MFENGEIRPINVQGTVNTVGGITIFAPQKGNRAIITQVNINHDAACIVSLYRHSVLTGKKILLYKISLNAGDIIDDGVGYNLGEGDSLYLVADSGGANWSVEGFEYEIHCLNIPTAGRGQLRVVDSNGNYKGIGATGPEGPPGPSGAGASVTSAEFVSLETMVISADAALSLRIDAVSVGSASVTSAEYLSLVNRVSSNSAQMTSADNAISNAVSIVSVAQAATSADLTSVKNVISVLSARVDSNSADFTSFKQSINNFGDVSISSPVSTQFLGYDSTTGQWLNKNIPGVSVTSAEYLSLVNRVSGNSTQMVSADDAISAAVVALSAQHTSLAASVAGALSAIAANSAQMTSADNAISNAVSIVSVAQAATSAAVTSVNNRVSAISTDVTSVKQLVSVISQQVSVLSARVATNSAQMTSADNAISNAVSIVSVAQAATSAAVTSVNDRVSGISTDVTSVKNLISVLSARVDGNSADFTSFKASINNFGDVSISSPTSTQVLRYVSATGQWVNQTITGGSGSVTSANFVSLRSVVQANSAQMTSADNAISAAIAALSAQHTSLAASVAGAISAIAANSAQMTSADNAISNAVSIVSAAQAATSADFTSFKASINNFGDVSISSPTSTQVLRYVSATGQWVNQTITGGSGSVTSANFVSLRSVVQANSAQMTSADNAISNAVSIVSAAQAVTSAAVTSINQIVSVISQQVSVLSVRVAANSVQMVSADNAISNAVSIVSVAQATTSAAVTSVNNRISGLSSDFTSFKASINNFGDVSISVPTDGQVLMYNASAGQWFNSTVPAGAGSVTSAELSAVSAAAASAISIVSAAVASVQSVVSALQYPAIESVTSAVYSVVEADRGKIKYFTNATSIEVVLPNGLTSGFQAVLWRGSAAGQLKISAATTLESQGTVLSSINTAATIINRGSNIWLAAGAFAGGGGTASVTSAQVASIASVVAANSVQLASVASVVHANSADFTSFKASINNFGDVSAVPSADQQVLTWNSAAGQWVASTITAGVGSVTSAELSAVSAAAASANQTLSARIGVLDTQIRIVSSMQSSNGSALVAISGMVLTVAANETWKIEGYMLMSTSATTAGLRMGFSVPPLSLPRFTKIIAGSAAQSAAIAGGGGQLQVSGQSIMLSITGIGPAGAAVPVKFDALFNVASAGTVNLMACGIASTAASPLHIMAGTHMICYRLK